METIVFYVFSAFMVLSALMVITVNNPVRAAFFLVLTFFASAAIWLLLEAEFLAVILIIVYVGAVMVLFLFPTRKMVEVGKHSTLESNWIYLGIQTMLQMV